MDVLPCSVDHVGGRPRTVVTTCTVRQSLILTVLAFQVFFYAHYGWIVNRDNLYIRLNLVRDWLGRCPEMLLIDLFFREISISIIKPFGGLQAFIESYLGW